MTLMPRLRKIFGFSYASVRGKDVYELTWPEGSPAEHGRITAFLAEHGFTPTGQIVDWGIVEPLPCHEYHGAWLGKRLAFLIPDAAGLDRDGIVGMRILPTTRGKVLKAKTKTKTKTKSKAKVGPRAASAVKRKQR